MENILEINDLSKSFILHNQRKNIHAVSNITITVKKGEFIGITGKSGSGKSTILKSIYGTYRVQEGDIWYDSSRFGAINLAKATEREMIYLRKHEIGYVSQFLNVMPRTTARQLVTGAILEMGQTREMANIETEKILGHFEIGKELWDSYPATFSGGEKLRLNIARAMVKRPRLLLLDEPTASLDHDSKVKVKTLLEQLMNEGTTMLGIFHDLEFMNRLVTREYSMQNGCFTQAIQKI
ncbi:phosphonate C-P lyase system protein PhnL [Peribacillus castrilensis]|uniref:ATP-binding cassette domain-containing protein n=1 Tax=Peribacillus castrilensis TaxID=2897690 RepID=A0AAW9NBC2_9BACI|nr:ATP-binding cassette domain-containing protein [Peribacillus frigoritolerans]MEC0272562.1 ATP-binding cassette domain-containing protein [Peribacillus castrilensis]QYF84523.1 ATP-binding cassette domain-containing protein [Brevibacterium sp. PAMC21349]MCP1154512.1 ATP-binding cassette domain-containing protein [Peribacillus frigoritolerans]MCT1387532.1 ATP-binding cassette domain-containing protein [Peribacillus frigoritolerans]MEB2627646.1 ATP-binding cassette domain-containing protein [Pe